MKWLVLVLLVPSAAALEALPDAKWGPHDATLVVRASRMILVEAEPPVLVVGAGESPVAIDASRATWRGLSGAMELKLHRASSEVVTIRVSEADAGVLFEWPAAKRVPGESAPAAFAAGLLAAAALLRGKRGNQS